jgi:hypothetical protein
MTIDQIARKGMHVAVPLMAILAAFQGCSGAVESNDSEDVAQTRQAIAADPVPCAAWSDAVVANTGSITVGASTLIDSYQSSLGAYGGTNVGSAAIVQAATTISNNGGVIHGTQKQHAPASFAVVPVPAGAKNLPLGSSSPGTLSIGSAAQSITLAPGNYVAANVNVNAPGAINISPAGQVRIWVTGSLNVGGNENLKGIPNDLAFLVTNSGFVNIGNGALYGLVYAPTSQVFVDGPVFGTVIGSTVNVNSGGAVHFDQSSVCAPSNGPKLDQSFTTGNDLSDGLYGHPVLMAQTYTAGITGTLQGVAIDVTSFSNFVPRIQVESVTAGVPSNVVLGQARASAAGDLSINTVIPFSTAIAQVAGQQYAILVDYPDAPTFFNGQASSGEWNGSDGNLYPAGTMFTTFDNGTTWTSFQSNGFDLHFQTFVVPN